MSILSRSQVNRGTLDTNYLRSPLSNQGRYDLDTFVTDFQLLTPAATRWKISQLLGSLVEALADPVETSRLFST
jgi:hypothetical protein